VLPSDEAYEQARRVWNGAVDRRPALVARCSGVVDVVRAVEFAREHGLSTAVRGGAHSVAGFGTCDGGIVIDLSRMRGIRLDLVQRTARVEAGATWGDLDHETQAYGLATTGGTVSTAGVVGLALGGGVGRLMRKHGLACDNLLAADVVTAGGRTLRASADENADLHWGIRGGGGNFGIVTSLELRLHPVGPDVSAGAVFFRGRDAGDVLRFCRDWVETAPDELTTTVRLATARAEPFLPEDLHGEGIVVVEGCYAGGGEAASEAFRPLQGFGSPVADTIGPVPYSALQASADSSWGSGARNAFESFHLRALTDDAIETLLYFHRRVTSPQSEIHVYNVGGAVARVPEGETAVAHRTAPFLVAALARSADGAGPDEHVEWARELGAVMAPWSTGPCVNFLGDSGDAVAAAYGERTLARLVALKNVYDPTNLFRINHNVAPTPLPSARRPVAV